MYVFSSSIQFEKACFGVAQLVSFRSSPVGTSRVPLR